MDFPLRILHVVVNMNRGGAETLIMNWYRNIDRSKIQFDFLTCKAGSFDSEIEKMGGKVHRIPYITDAGHFRYIRALKDFFLAHPEYRAIHSHMDKMSGFVLREAQKAGVPIRISHSHNTSSEGGFAAKGYKWYAGNYICQNASHFFACSSHASEWLYGNRVNQTVILKNGIDADLFNYSATIEGQMRKEFGLEKKHYVIGHVGRFCRQKNHSFLIDVFSEIHKINPNAFLVLAGEGPLKVDVVQKVKRLGLSEKVKFLGNRGDIHKVLQSFDVMLFPSFHEGLPVSLIEAQAAGVPCIISEAVSKEVDMGAELIKFANINGSPRLWAYLALLSDKSKEAGTAHLQDKGYEIGQSAGWLQSFYLKTLGKSGGMGEKTG
ncbi:MAG TPA: glycosyltransferase family 1 protein [Bacillales bacterium]|nr:glycosyltransferase family 1 protein [Bacillales bacterium]